MPASARSPYDRTEHLVARNRGDEADAYAQFKSYARGIRTEVSVFLLVLIGVYLVWTCKR